MKSLDRAVTAGTLFAAIQQDPKAAKERYSRTVGIGNVYYYFIAGVGRVVSIDTDSVALCLHGDGSGPDILIATGRIFGNAIRNGTALLDVNDFPNSQDFNNVSIEINRIVESQVLPGFREKAAVGSSVRFVGCAQIMDEDADLRPMRIIPIVLEVK